jgi:hypothetical protein
MANLVDAGGDELAASEKPDMDDLERLGRRLGQKAAKFMLPKLLEKFEKQIREAVKHYLVNLSSTQVLALAAAATTAEISTQGEAAEVKLLDPKTGQPFRFRMQRDPATRSGALQP